MDKKTFRGAVKQFLGIALLSVLLACALIFMDWPHDRYKWILLLSILVFGGLITTLINHSYKIGGYFFLIGAVFQICVWHLFGSYIYVFGHELDILWISPPLIACIHAYFFSEEGTIGMKLLKGLMVSYIVGLPFICLKVINTVSSWL